MLLFEKNLNMPCLHKYLLKELIKLYFIIQSIILVLFVFIEYLSMMNKFLNSDITLLGALGFVLLEIPFMFVRITPASILLANIFVFAMMNKNYELLALRSSGISLFSIIKSSVFSGIVIMIIMVMIREIIVPISMVKAHDIEYNIIKHKKKNALGRNDVWIRSGKELIHFDHYDPVKQSVSGITIISMGTDFQLESRLDAKKGKYIKGKWVFKKIIRQIYNKGGDDYTISSFDKKNVDLDIIPEDFGQMVKKSDEMDFFELKEYVNKIKSEGYDATTYLVDLHGKIAFPFICVIMAFFGAATGMKSFAKENIPKAVVIGIVISFLYWFLHGFCMSLGYGNFLQPMVAAWTANLLFFAMSAYVLLIEDKF